MSGEDIVENGDSLSRNLCPVVITGAFGEVLAAENIQGVAEGIVKTVGLDGFEVDHVPKRLKYKQLDD